EDMPSNLQEALQDLADKLRGREDMVHKLLEQAKPGK
ncbi:hypothetical protein LCGC14_2014750, partial [marine sediment metagenome]